MLLAGDKYAELRKEIKEIFENNFNAYGYRRIWKALRNNGKIVSEKVVQRIMKEDQLVPYFKRRKKYSSYEGEPTPAVSNVIERNLTRISLTKSSWQTSQNSILRLENYICLC